MTQPCFGLQSQCFHIWSLCTPHYHCHEISQWTICWNCWLRVCIQVPRTWKVPWCLLDFLDSWPYITYPCHCFFFFINQEEKTLSVVFPGKVVNKTSLDYCFRAWLCHYQSLTIFCTHFSPKWIASGSYSKKVHWSGIGQLSLAFLPLKIYLLFSPFFHTRWWKFRHQSYIGLCKIE